MMVYELPWPRPLAMAMRSSSGSTAGNTAFSSRVTANSQAGAALNG